MKLTAKSNKPFEAHPEYTGPAVCVDVTPLKTVSTEYGPKEKFRLVFETGCLREDGKPYLVWSRGFTPSLGEKSSFRAYLKQWMGRDLTSQEQEEFDTETLIGRTAHLVVVHNAGANGEVYANIGLIRPDKSAHALNPSGNYIRVKDRVDKDASFHRVDNPSNGAAANGSNDWRRTRVHVGKHAGIELCDLDPEAIRNLHERWLPAGKAMAKPLKADRDLIAALEKAATELGITQPAEDNIPY